MGKTKTYSVITGDIIGSSGLKDSDKDLIVGKMTRDFSTNKGIILPIKFYRGDSFQLLVESQYAIFYAILIEATIIELTGTMARISIGIGTVSNINHDDVLQSDGEAFVLSGRNLDQMKSLNRELMISTPNKNKAAILDIAILMATEIVRGWKPAQASVISRKLKGLTQREIAKALSISEASVSKTVKTAKWNTIESFLDWYKKFMKGSAK